MRPSLKTPCELCNRFCINICLQFLLPGHANNSSATARVMLAMFHLTEDSIGNRDQKFIVHISRVGFLPPEVLWLPDGPLELPSIRSARERRVCGGAVWSSPVSSPFNAKDPFDPTLDAPIPASPVLTRLFCAERSELFSAAYTKPEEKRNVIRPTPPTAR